jgi:hypothetical protein
VVSDQFRVSFVISQQMAHHAQHAWSFLHVRDLAQKLSKLGLVLNRLEPALICNRCEYALQPVGKSECCCMISRCCMQLFNGMVHCGMCKGVGNNVVG